MLDKDYSVSRTKDNDFAIFTKQDFNHYIEKEDKRERYATYIKATLQDPYEVYLTEYSNGKSYDYRKTYIGIFKDKETKEDIFIALRKEKDGFYFHNSIMREKNKIDKLRKGFLIYKK